MWFFKKSSPKTKVLLSNGAWLEFENVDHEWGIYPPEGKGISEWMATELRSCISAGRGGLVEIGQAEYLSLIQKKKSASSTPRWREELGKSTMLQTAIQSRSARKEREDAEPAGTVEASVIHQMASKVAAATNPPEERPSARKT